jgi:hypothetical protein
LPHGQTPSWNRCKIREREEVDMNVDAASKQFYHEYILFNILQPQD